MVVIPSEARDLSLSASGMTKTYYVYLATNVNRNVLYVGVTNDPARRLDEHRRGVGGAFSTLYKVNTLVHLEAYDRVEEAIAREKRIKGWRRSKKDALVESLNPAWADIGPTLAGDAPPPVEAKGPSRSSG